MEQYHDFLWHILESGEVRTDRTGVGTIGVFGYQMRFNLAKGFPLVTTKRVHMKSIIHELLWFISGSTNNGVLNEAGVRIWDEWATAEQCAKFGREAGDLGPIYGHQWRNFGASKQPDGTYASDGVDQLLQAIHLIKTTPDSRRIIVSGWNPKEATDVTLPPCHTLFQFYVQNRKLSCQLYQRSGDAFLGVPFNIASYALLTQMIAHVVGLELGHFVHTFGDAHIYKNHLEQVKEQLSRKYKPLPTMNITRKVSDIRDFRYEDFDLLGYDPHPAIRAVVAV